MFGKLNHSLEMLNSFTLNPQFQPQPQPQVHFHHQAYRLHSFSATSPVTQIVKFSFRSPISTSQWRRGGGRGLVPCPHATVSRQAHGTFDPDIRSVLELATDSELYELENILFGSSYFSPLLKSVTKRADVDYFMIEEDPHERDNFIAILESRFLFLAADARSTLRGWRPSYRDVLLQVREKLKIPCSRKLSTEDLEAEIFLHLMQEYSSHESNTFQTGSLELGLSQWKVQAIAGLKIGASEIRKMILKGGGMLTLGKLYQLLANKLLGRMFLEAANYQIKNEVIKKGIAGAAARYLGLRSMMTLLGPMLWGTFLADVVIQMLGTDYARILRAIFAFAQIRIARTYRLPLYIDQED